MVEHFKGTLERPLSPVLCLAGAWGLKKNHQNHRNHDQNHDQNHDHYNEQHESSWSTWSLRWWWWGSPGRAQWRLSWCPALPMCSRSALNPTWSSDCRRDFIIIDDHDHCGDYILSRWSSWSWGNWCWWMRDSLIIWFWCLKQSAFLGKYSLSEIWIRMQIWPASICR